jgi:hypothetical protein
MYGPDMVVSPKCQAAASRMMMSRRRIERKTLQTDPRIFLNAFLSQERHAPLEK